jgi:hypothetical protein
MARTPGPPPTEPLPHRWIVLAVILGLGLATAAAFGVRELRQLRSDNRAVGPLAERVCAGVQNGMPAEAAADYGRRHGVVEVTPTRVRIVLRVGRSKPWECVAAIVDGRVADTYAQWVPDMWAD